MKNSNLKRSKYVRKAYMPEREKDKLDDYDIKSFMKDNAINASLAKVGMSKRDWIVTKRFELQDSCPRPERKLGLYLLSKGFNFVHQQPFVISGKIYFLDYYLPLQRIAIEVDGQSHNCLSSQEKDKDRDKAFRCIGIKTLRISNAETDKKCDIETFLRANGVKYPTPSKR